MNELKEINDQLKSLSISVEMISQAITGSKLNRNGILQRLEIIEETLVETEKYPNVWLTVNEHNKSLYEWFVRVSRYKKTNLVNQWPEVYRQFKPLGQRVIYNTTQYVVELKRTKMTDQEKLDFIKTRILRKLLILELFRNRTILFK